METVILYRDENRKDVTRGTLYCTSGSFQILERPWKNNQRNQSCIPAGDYEATYMEKSASGKYKNIYLIRGVAGRSGILIHNGNVVDHSRGCLIIGMRRGQLAGKAAVLNSRTALTRFVNAMKKQPFRLKIIGNQTLEEQ